jgi:hypothetical protein
MLAGISVQFNVQDTTNEGTLAINSLDVFNPELEFCLGIGNRYEHGATSSGGMVLGVGDVPQCFGT